MVRAVCCEPVSGWQFPANREFYWEFCDSGPQKPISLHETTVLQPLLEQFPKQIIRENNLRIREFLNGIRELQPKNCPAFDMAMRFGGRVMRHESTVR